MKHITMISLTCILLIAFSGGQADPAPAIGEMQKQYNSDDVTTIKCAVKESGKVTQVWGPIKGMSYGINLKVQTETEMLTVYLGPAWFIDRQNMKFDKDDVIEVKGCKKIFNGEPVIVAEEVKKGDIVLRLRDSAGNPVWGEDEMKKVNY